MAVSMNAKNLFFLLVSIISPTLSLANDYEDKDCQIFVSKAENEITGGNGNWLNADVVVKRTLIDQYYQAPQVKIVGFENKTPSAEFEINDAVIYRFTHFSPGVAYKYNTASIQVYVSNGVDRLFDKNNEVKLVPENRWIYSNPKCRL